MCELHKNKKLFSTLPIAFLLSTAFPVGFALVSPEATALNADITSRVDLKTDSPLVLAMETNNQEIVLGESVHVREQREQAEAVAKAAKSRAIVQKAKAQVVVVRSTAPEPSDLNALYQSAGGAYGVDPALLRAIHVVETGASGSTARRNPSGATGPMQFLPSTFKAHGVDGNGDGVKDITNVSDSIYSAAKYLVACGYPNVKKALWGYNPSASYYNKVIGLAQSYGMK